MRAAVWLLTVAAQAHAALQTCPTHQADALGIEVPKGARCCLGANDVATAHPDRMAVLAGATTKLHWVETLLPDVGYVVYAAKDTTAGNPAWTVKQRCPAAYNNGAFVHFIVDNWDCLPAQVIFLHDHRFNDHAKHTTDAPQYDYPRKHIDDAVDTLDMVHNLCWDKTAELRYYPLSPVVDTTRAARLRDVGEPRSVIGIIPEGQESVKFHCCGQMVVTRGAIRARGLGFWVSVLQDLCRIRRNTYVHSWVMEVMWDTMLGFPNRPQSAVPSVDDMYSCHRRNLTLIQNHVRRRHFFNPSRAIHSAKLPQPPQPPPARHLKLHPAACPVNVPGIDLGEGEAAKSSRLCCREVLGTTPGWASRMSGDIAALNILTRHTYGMDPVKHTVLLGPPVFPVDETSQPFNWPDNVENPQVCAEAGVLARLVQGIVSNWDCLPQWVLLTDTMSPPIAVWRQGGLGFLEVELPADTQLLEALARRRATTHFDFTNSICFDKIPTGFLSYGGRRVTETVSRALTSRLIRTWRDVLKWTRPHPNFSRISYFPTPQGVVSRARLRRVGLKVFKSMLKDLCDPAASPWDKSLTEQAHLMLWSTHIVGAHTDPVPVLRQDDRFMLGALPVSKLLSCNNTVVDTSELEIKPTQV